MYTSQHVYPSNYLGIFLQRDLGLGLVLVLVKGLKCDFLARILPYHKQEMEKRKTLRVG